MNKTVPLGELGQASFKMGSSTDREKKLTVTLSGKSYDIRYNTTKTSLDDIVNDEFKDRISAMIRGYQGLETFYATRPNNEPFANRKFSLINSDNGETVIRYNVKGSAPKIRRVNEFIENKEKKAHFTVDSITNLKNTLLPLSQSLKKVDNQGKLILNNEFLQDEDMVLELKEEKTERPLPLPKPPKNQKPVRKKKVPKKKEKTEKTETPASNLPKPPKVLRSEKPVKTSKSNEITEPDQVSFTIFDENADILSSEADFIVVPVEFKSPADQKQGLEKAIFGRIQHPRRRALGFSEVESVKIHKQNELLNNSTLLYVGKPNNAFFPMKECYKQATHDFLNLPGNKITCFAFPLDDLSDDEAKSIVQDTVKRLAELNYKGKFHFKFYRKKYN